MRTSSAILAIVLAAAAPVGAEEPPWVSIFDGSLTGWHTTGGARWWVEDGAICGTQSVPGVGGFIFTDRRTFRDFELQTEVWIDYGHDSGIHLRDKTMNPASTTGDGYQACLDYFGGRGSYGGFYYKGPKEDYAFWETTWPFRLTGPDTIGANTDMDPARVTPVLPSYAAWTPVFNANARFALPPLVQEGGWNTVRVRIENDPPLYNCWINGLHVVRYQADRQWTSAREGMIGFQIINNSRRWPAKADGRVKFRGIQVRELDQPAVPRPGRLRLSAQTVSVLEGEGQVVLRVLREDGLDGTVGATWRVAGGTASAGSDYAIASGSITLADGQSSVDIGIPLVQDAISESSESFELVLEAPVGGAVLGTPSASVVVIADDDGVPAAGIAIDPGLVTGYAGEDAGGVVAVSGDGMAIQLTGNAWKKLPVAYAITPSTVLEFEFRCDVQGELHGIGLDDDDVQDDRKTWFQLYGTQSSRKAWQEFRDYATPGVWVPYRIPIGAYVAAPVGWLTLINDHDVAQPGASSWFRNIRLVEAAAGSG